MIYTVTMNPSIDYIVSVDEIRLGGLNRTSQENHFAGGKGINISLVLHNLGMESTCLGFVAGYVGEQIQKLLLSRGIRTGFTEIPDGCSRINVKVKETSGRETEINGSGPVIGEVALEKLRAKLELLQAADVLVLSGNVPPGVSKGVYGELAALAVSKGAEVTVDAEKALLEPALKSHPLLVKPHRLELEEIAGRALPQQQDIREGALSLQEKGARNVLVSLGGEGAYFLSEDGGDFFWEAPRGKAVNTVGCGDSMVAGFLYRRSTGGSLADAARYAMAAGTAGAFSKLLPEKEGIDAIYCAC